MSGGSGSHPCSHLTSRLSAESQHLDRAAGGWPRSRGFRDLGSGPVRTRRGTKSKWHEHADCLWPVRSQVRLYEWIDADRVHRSYGGGNGCDTQRQRHGIFSTCRLAGVIALCRNRIRNRVFMMERTLRSARTTQSTWCNHGSILHRADAGHHTWAVRFLVPPAKLLTVPLAGARSGRLGGGGHYQPTDLEQICLCGQQSFEQCGPSWAVLDGMPTECAARGLPGGRLW